VIGLFAVRGTSMGPSLLEGDLVVTVSPRLRAPRPGDVVVAAEPFGLVIHRIIRLLETPDGRWSCLLRGDANGAADPFAVASDEILGVVVARLERCGRLRLALERSTVSVLRKLRRSAGTGRSGGYRVNVR
jgi:hypothetical protein